jgi:hypothetical protein
MTLLDDIRRHICRFGPPRSLLVELERGAHPTIFSASRRTLNLTGRVMHDPAGMLDAQLSLQLSQVSFPRDADLALVPSDSGCTRSSLAAAFRLRPRTGEKVF